jgi:alkylation response protein AidB-like acyl-CoA dehydrogenase
VQVFFENVEVPVENLLGREGDGFLIGMKVFDKSRPPVAAAATGVARRALDEAVRMPASAPRFRPGRSTTIRASASCWPT